MVQAGHLVNHNQPHPLFFVSADSKGVTGAPSVSADSKEFICTILVQFAPFFVSVANAGVKVVCLHTLSDVWKTREAAKWPGGREEA